MLRVLEWVRRSYPIDSDHITITGPSMGGIGAAAIAFRHPDLVAAAAPLCGYHSYFVRRDVMGRPMRPWAHAHAEERSNVEWAVNGENIPLWIVHGTQDLPETNSGVLIDRYEALSYSIKHDHPNLGHNVWQTTYEGMKGAKWLLAHARVDHPKHVRFRPARRRAGDDAWVHVGELAAPDASGAGEGWGEVEGRVTSRQSISATTRGVLGLRLDRDPVLVDPAASLTVTIDGAHVLFGANEPAELHREGATWMKGLARHDFRFMHADRTGPLRAAFPAPLLFVYGASDAAQARANEEVAHEWAKIRWGTTIKYPVMSDVEFFDRGEALPNDHALFLVGNAKSNAVVRALEGELPITVDGDAVLLGGKRITGSQVGAAFIRPNPRRPDRYLVVVEGVDALGTWRSLSSRPTAGLRRVGRAGRPCARASTSRTGAPAGGRVLRERLVASCALRGPLASRPRPKAKSEYDATPYLP